MFKTDVKKIDFGGKNILKAYNVNLDDDLDCIIVLSAKDEKLGELLYHKVMDSVIDRIHPKNVYKDFSNSLENINSFLSSWQQGGDKIKGLHGIIAVYHKKTFLFSTVGTSSCYLFNSRNELIEISDKNESSSDFSFISSGDVSSGESIILSNTRLLDILSADDIKDGLSNGDISRSGDNIEKILMQEHEGKNIAVVGCTKLSESEPTTKINYDKISYYCLRACDNHIAKKMLGYIYFSRDFLLSRSQKVKQILLGVGVLVSVFILYNIISGFFSMTSNTYSLESAKQELILAQSSIVSASENMNNEDMYTLNIEQAEEIILKLEQEQLFISDVGLLKDRIGILQKQFNGIQPFATSSENTLYSFDTEKEIVKVLSLDGQIYVVHRDSITGPILKGESAENFEFSELSGGDYFIDATTQDSNVVLMTSAGKVVNFAKNNYFSYVDVLDQVTWEESPIISSYANNIYLLSDSGNQILRHKKQSSSYDSGVAYLKDQDAIDTGRILSLAIDGGIYILKLDGSIIKLFRSPEYRLESLVLNKLPKNYNFQNLDGENLPSLRAKANLKYVYMLLDNRILVFSPNTSNYRDVKSLSYIGQIEGKDIVIEDFYVDNDGDIIVAGNRGIYQLEFEVDEEDLIIK
ncbi:hypothetical protein LR010_00300 [Candidatus Gracilibacteria bacterium]|nr:hypothetical protein [Candidatus Gracilibacteria bacterium]